MKFSITIDGDTMDAQSVSVLALLASIAEGTVPNIPMFQPQPGAAAVTQTGTADAEDEGTVNANAPAVDTAGLPWDERIHAKTKATIADGTWRKRRNVNDMLVQQVEAELRARIAAQPAAVQQMPQPGATAPLPDPAAIAAANAGSGVQQPSQGLAATAPAQQIMPDPSQIAAQQQQVQQPAATGDLTFAKFMQAVSGAMQTGKIDASYLANLAAQHEISAVTAVSTDPAKMLTIYQQMQIEGKI